MRSAGSPHSRPRTLWEEGSAPGHEVAALTVAVLLTATVCDLLLSDGLGLIFDLTLVTVSVWAALSIRPADFFTVGVLPPLATVTTVVLVAAVETGAVARVEDGVVQATITGLSTHSLALVVGYLLCLGILAVRRHVLTGSALGD